MRPLVHVNAAMSLDGKIAVPDGRQTRISGDADMRRVHALRAASDAILVGIGTVLKDDPSLLVKRELLGPGAAGARDPVRIVMDGRVRTPASAKVFRPGAPTWIASVEENASGPAAKALALAHPDCRILACGKGRVDIGCLLDVLGGEGVRTLMVEGGSTVISSYLRGGFADRLTVYVGSVVIGGATSPTLAGGEGARDPQDLVRMRLADASRLDDGILLTYEALR